MAIWHHPDHEEDEEAVGEADAEQPDHVDDREEVHFDDHVEENLVTLDHDSSSAELPRNDILFASFRAIWPK